MVVEAIRNDAEWKNGDYEQQPHAYSRMVPFIAIMVGSPEKYPTRVEADAWYERMTKGAYQRADANDRLYMMLPATTARLLTSRRLGPSCS